MGLGHAPVQAIEMLNKSTKKQSVAWSLVHKWHKRYSEGQKTIMDDDVCGCLVPKFKASDITFIKYPLDVDWHVNLA